MSYILSNSFRIALQRISPNSDEHRTGTVTNGLLNHYFNANKFAVTPESIGSNQKRPDYLVESVQGNHFTEHAVAEIKSQSGDSFGSAADQVIEAITETLDLQGNYTIFVVLVKGRFVNLKLSKVSHSIQSINSNRYIWVY